jgi:phosphoribosylamine--glycine ligase
VNGQWLVAETSGVILIVVGMGPPCGKLNRKSILESNVLIPNMYYRTDIGDRWVEETDRLHTWGYLR